MKTLKIAAVIGLLTLGACATDGNQAKPGEFGLNKTTAGTGLGAIGGALLGSQFGGGKGQLIGVAAGTLLGAYAGNQIGASLDRADQAYAQKAEQSAYAAPVGQRISWNNPESGNAGTITPTREGRDQTGNTCREFQQTITVAGKTEQAFGTACRQSDGTWKIQ